MVLWLAALAGAAPDPGAPIEEIIVYGDEFARWDETRWLVQSELWVPLGLWFASDRNLAFQSQIFRIDAVVLCDKDAKLGRHKYEVTCKIEDVGLRATSIRNWKRDRDRQIAQTVLEEVDAKLTGTVVQLQVDDKGGVTNFDLEGIETTNERERTIQETLRQLVSRTMAGFHLRIPEHAQRSGQWIEYNSELMDLPSLTSSRGSTTLVHQVNPYQSLQIVQTVGEGTVAVSVPNPRQSAGLVESAIQDLGTAGARGAPTDAGAGTVAEVTSTNASTAGGELSIEMTYALKAVGVAVFRKEDGIMTERVWAVDGRPTAGSAGGVDTGPFRNAGRLRLLAKDEAVDVGRSEQVAWPGRQMEALPPWISLETLPQGG